MWCLPCRTRIFCTIVFAALFLAAHDAEATVVFSGPVSPSDPGDGDLETTLEVGVGADPYAVDPRATVTVSNSSLEFDEAYIGSDDGFFGRMYVSGAAGRFNVESNGNNSDPALKIGREGNGYLEISGGAILEMEDPQGDAVIGEQSTSFGKMVVTGEFTFASIGENFTIGDDGVGQLEILSGAILRTRDTGGAAVVIGAATGSVGSVLVDGDGSVLQAADDLRVGENGVASLTISGGGLVDADNSGNVTTVGALGEILLAGGTLAVDTLHLDGLLGGDGLVRGDGSGFGTVTASEGSRIEVGAGQRLQFLDDVSNQGSIHVEGGELEFLDGFTNNNGSSNLSPGRITLEDAAATFSQDLDNEGVIAVAAGSSHLYGEIRNESGAAITVAHDAVATFHDPYTDDGGNLTILGTGNALFLSDFTFSSSGMLALELASATSGPALSVAGEAVLGGELHVTLPINFDPEVGQTYMLLNATSLSGAFDTPVLPVLGGNLGFQLVQDSTTLGLLVVDAGIPGDFNADGVVDAADYTVWRDGLGTTYQQNDYDTWVLHFGESASASTSASVPEPTSLMLVALAGVLATARPRRVA